MPRHLTITQQVSEESYDAAMQAIFTDHLAEFELLTKKYADKTKLALKNKHGDDDNQSVDNHSNHTPLTLTATPDDTAHAMFNDGGLFEYQHINDLLDLLKSENNPRVWTLITLYFVIKPIQVLSPHSKLSAAREKCIRAFAQQYKEPLLNALRSSPQLQRILTHIANPIIIATHNNQLIMTINDNIALLKVLNTQKNYSARVSLDQSARLPLGQTKSSQELLNLMGWTTTPLYQPVDVSAEENRLAAFKEAIKTHPSVFLFSTEELSSSENDLKQLITHLLKQGKDNIEETRRHIALSLIEQAHVSTLPPDKKHALSTFFYAYFLHHDKDKKDVNLYLLKFFQDREEKYGDAYRGTFELCVPFLAVLLSGTGKDSFNIDWYAHERNKRQLFFTAKNHSFFARYTLEPNRFNIFNRIIDYRRYDAVSSLFSSKKTKMREAVDQLMQNSKENPSAPRKNHA